MRDLRVGRENAAIVQTVLDLSRAFGLTSIAEGIEEPEIAEILCDMGCNEGQGFLFCKPLPAEEMTAFLRERT